MYLRWIRDLNVKETKSFLGESIGEYHHDCKDFQTEHEKALAIKAKIDKSNFIKIKNVCSSKTPFRK